MVRYGTGKYYRVQRESTSVLFPLRPSQTTANAPTHSFPPRPDRPKPVSPMQRHCLPKQNERKIKIKGQRATETPSLPPLPRLASPFMLHYTTNSKQQTEDSNPTTKHNTAGHGNMQSHYVSGFLPSKIRPTIANRFSTISSSSCSTISTKDIMVLCVFQILFYRT